MSKAEQPARAEAQQPSDGLVEELERRATFGGEIGTFQCPPELTARILAALKTRTSPETVEQLAPSLCTAFRTTVSTKDTYEMVFRFPTMEAMHEADREWHRLRSAHVSNEQVSDETADNFIKLHEEWRQAMEPLQEARIVEALANVAFELESTAPFMGEQSRPDMLRAAAHCKAAVVKLDAHLSDTPAQGSDPHG